MKMRCKSKGEAGRSKRDENINQKIMEWGKKEETERRKQHEKRRKMKNGVECWLGQLWL